MKSKIKMLFHLSISQKESGRSERNTLNLEATKRVLSAETTQQGAYKETLKTEGTLSHEEAHNSYSLVAPKGQSSRLAPAVTESHNSTHMYNVPRKSHESSIEG
jgi:hypothetical protein